MTFFNIVIMKKILLTLVCCVALIGCNSDLGDYDKVKFQGKNIAGWWAEVGYNGVYYDEVEDCIIFDGDNLMSAYVSGVKIINGILQAPKEAALIYDTEKFYLDEAGNIYLDGEINGQLSWDGDKLIWRDSDGYYIHEQVKGFN